MNINDYQLPYSPEAERSVLGSMMIDPKCIPDVLEVLKPDDFYLPQNRDIFTTMYTMFNHSVELDPVTLMDYMKQSGFFHAETEDYLKQILELTPTAANASLYTKIVSDKSLLRRIATASGEISGMVSDGVGSAQEILDATEQKIYAIRNGRSNQDMTPVRNVILSVYDLLAERAASGSAIPGLSTGLKDLDTRINGLNKSDLMLLAARPGMGKTSMALNIALAVAKKEKKTVAIFSLEMSKEQLTTRLLSSESFVDNQLLMTGKLTDDDWRKLGIAASALAATDIRIDDNPSITVTEMNAKCRRMDNLGLVIIDYLQLMTSATGNVNDNRVTAISEITRFLKIMAKELNIPVICLSQLSRANESRNDKRPILSDLRDSGAIEQDADEVLFLYRDDYYNPESAEKNVAECIIAKNRHGETGTVKLQWLPQYTTFSDREWRHNER